MAAISKFARNFVKSAIEAGDTKTDTIVEGLVRTFGLNEKEANSLIGEVSGKTVEEVPTKSASKTAALKEKGVPKAVKPKKSTEKVVEGPIQGPRPLSTEDFEATSDQTLDITKPRKDVSFPGTTTYPTTEGVLVGGAADRTPRVEPGSELVTSRGGVPARTSQTMEAEYLPPVEDRGTTDLTLSKRPAQEGKQETGLVPTGRKSTTFIAGEEGIGAGTRPPEGVARTVEERLRVQEARANSVSPEAEAIPESYKSKGLAIPLAGATTLAGALTRDQNGKESGEVPAGAETAKEVKLAPPAAPTPKGGVGTKPTDTKPVTAGRESQATTTQAIAGAAKLSDKIAASKSGTASKPTLDELTGYLDNVAKDVNNDPRFNNTNIERDLLAARADAYKMYKEKADRNQLLGTVERAINAIAQFASAQAGFGTRQAGGNLPLSSADYGGQTEQAFREYQTELGLLGEEQKLGERAKERAETAKEKEIGRRQKTIQEKIETERDILKEAAAEKRAQIAAGGRESALNAKEDAAAKKEISRQNKAALSGVLAQEKAISAQIAAINALSSAGKTSDRQQAIAKYATTAGIPVEEVNAELAKEDSFFESNKAKSFAAKKASELSEKLRQLQARQEEIVSGLSGGAQPSPTTQPTGQAPAGNDTTGVPAVGTVQGGYKFRGGNPADPKNWDKI